MTCRNPPVPVRPGHRSAEHPSHPSGGMDLDRAVAELNRIYIGGSLRTVLAMGRYILDTFFNGDADAFLSHSPTSISLNELYRRNDLAMSRSTLGTSVGMLLQFEAMPRQLADRLNASQHRALLTVTDPQARKTRRNALIMIERTL
jgi:hypothetical protein